MAVTAVIKNLEKSPNDKTEIPEFDATYDDSVDYKTILLQGSEKQLVARGVSAMMKYQRTRTEALKEVARIIVSLRAKCEYNGCPDWAGNTRKAKDLAAEIYTKAGVDKDSESSMRKALSYHIGNLVRRVATTNELKVAGLIVAPQSARQVQKAAAGKKALTEKKATPKKKTAEEVLEEQDLEEEGPIADNPFAHINIALRHLETASMLLAVKSEDLPKLKKEVDVLCLTARDISSAIAHRMKNEIEEAKRKGALKAMATEKAAAARRTAAAKKATPTTVAPIQKSA